MPVPSRKALELAERWSLAPLERRTRGPAGARLAAGTGSSLEFQDRRPYELGDDPRQLDWRAYARTEELMVKVHREEVAPRLDLLLDLSRSMRVDERKAQRAFELAELCTQAARRDGATVRRIALADRAWVVEAEEVERGEVLCDGATELASVLHEAAPLLRPSSVRLLITDALTPGDPTVLARLLARQAGGLAVIQVLTDAELHPASDRALRLVDAESGEARELVLDEAAVARYRSRLDRLIGDLATECRRLGGVHALVAAESELDSCCREVLAAHGLLVPRVG